MNSAEDTNGGEPLGVDEIILDYLDRMELGEPVTPEKIMAEHADLGPHLMKRFAALALIEAARIPQGPAAGLLNERIGEEFVLCWPIGAGGMSEVYLAEQVALRRYVAVKFPRLPPGDAGADERFRREARIAGELRHPNIVAVITTGIHDGRPYIVSEYVEGISCDRLVGLLGEPDTSGELKPLLDPALQRLLEQGIRWSGYWQMIASAAAGLARGIDYAHRRGVVHRDIKPSNLFLTVDGRLVVTDFGVARFAVEDTITAEGQVLGTPAYMSPEQARGDMRHVDHRTDVYSLGLSLYELLTLNRPFSSHAGHSTVRRRRPSAGSGLRSTAKWLPTALERVIERATAWRPEDRYGSAAEMADHLDRIAKGASLSTPSASSPNRRLLGYALAPVLLAVLMCVGLAVWPTSYVSLSLSFPEGANARLLSLSSNGDRTLLSGEESIVPAGRYKLTVTQRNRVPGEEVIILGPGGGSNRHGHAYLDSRILLQFDTEGENYSSPAIHDFDGDGFLEVVGCTTKTSGGELYLFNAMGANSKWECSGTSEYGMHPSPVVRDIDGDAEAEIVTVVNRGGSGHVVALDVLFDATGFVLKEIPTFKDCSLEGISRCTPEVEDLDGDGQPEVVVGTDNGLVWAFGADGQLRWKHKLDGAGERQILYSARAVDLDGDGFLEVVVGSGHVPDENVPGSLLILSGAQAEHREGRGILASIGIEGEPRGYPEYVKDRNEPDIWTWVFVGTGAGMNAVKVGSAAWDTAVRKQEAAAPWCRPALYDLDGDGIDEVLVTGHGGRVRYLWYTTDKATRLGSFTYSRDLREEVGGATSLTGLAFTEPDETRHAQMVFGSREGVCGRVFFVSVEPRGGSTLPLGSEDPLDVVAVHDAAPPIEVDQAIEAHPAVADLNNDGDPDVVVPCMRGRVLVLNMPGFSPQTLWTSKGYPDAVLSAPVAFKVGSKPAYSRIAFASRRPNGETRLSAWEAAVADGKGQYGRCPWLAWKVWDIKVDEVSPVLDSAGDLNGDGIEDLAVHGVESSRRFYYSGDSGGTLEEAGAAREAPAPQAEDAPPRIAISTDERMALQAVESTACADKGMVIWARIAPGDEKRVGLSRSDPPDVASSGGRESPAEKEKVIWAWIAPDEEYLPFRYRERRKITALEWLDWDGDGIEGEILAAWEGGGIWIVKPRMVKREGEPYVWTLTQRPYRQ